MDKIKYYRLESSKNEEEIGSIYADTLYQINDFIDSENNSQQRFKDYSDIYGDIDENLDLTKFKVHSKAKITDLLYARFFWHKCFYSPKFMQLYENFKAEKAKMIPCKIHHKKKIHDYFLMQLEETNQMINFEESEFTVFEKDTDKIEYIYKENVTEDTFWNIARTIMKDSEDKHTIKPTKLVLNRPSDLFNLEINGMVYISEDFKKAIEKEELTGFEFSDRPLKIEFYKNW